MSLRMPAGDARRFTRFPVKISACVSLVPESSPDDKIFELLRPQAHPIIVSDLSASGMYFMSNLHLEQSQQLWVELKLQGESILIRALVLRQQVQVHEDKKIYGYGAQFMRSDF